MGERLERIGDLHHHLGAMALSAPGWASSYVIAWDTIAS
jgi:hypothetical protein